MTAAVGTEERRRRDRRGRRAEARCLWLLRLCGYRVLARRLRTPAGEIDIVARRGRVLAFIEVKTRETVAVAVDAIAPRQRRRIERAAQTFLARRPDLARLTVRFDAMFVVPGRLLPVHFPNAWSADAD